MERKRAYRPKTCEICKRALESASSGRPRLTCSDRCRQIKRRRYDYAGWKDKRRREQARGRAERQICKWEKQTGLDFNHLPGYRREPEAYAMSLRERLMIYLPRGWPVQECWTCGRPYLADGRISPTCSEKCHRERKKYFEAVKHSYAVRPRVHEAELRPYLRAGKRLGLCARCGDPFVATRSDRKFCSDRCRKAAWERARSRLRRWPYGRKPIKKFCVGCGRKFTPSSPSHQVTQEFCTSECYGRTRHRIKRSGASSSLPNPSLLLPR